jgi:hypothetical protein
MARGRVVIPVTVSPTSDGPSKQDYTESPVALASVTRNETPAFLPRDRQNFHVSILALENERLQRDP